VRPSAVSKITVDGRNLFGGPPTVSYTFEEIEELARRFPGVRVERGETFAIATVETERHENDPRLDAQRLSHCKECVPRRMLAVLAPGNVN
jgi:hypothetical protein